jgi:hypothetical protein
MIRGDVILVRFPHPSGLCGKKRPVVVVETRLEIGGFHPPYTRSGEMELARTQDLPS